LGVDVVGEAPSQQFNGAAGSQEFEAIFTVRPSRAVLSDGRSLWNATLGAVWDHCCLFVVTVAVWGSVVLLIVVTPLVFGLLFVTGVMYLMFGVFGAGICCKDCCRGVHHLVYRNSVAVRYALHPTRAPEELRQRLEEYVSARIKALAIFSNYRRETRRTKNGTRTTYRLLSRYVLGLPLESWEDTSPEPNQYIGAVNSLGLSSALIDINANYSLEASQNVFLERLQNRYGPDLKGAADTQRFEFKIEPQVSESNAIGDREMWVLGKKRCVCFFNPCVYFLTNLTTTFLLYEMVARCLAPKYVYPVNKHVRLKVNRAPWFEVNSAQINLVPLNELPHE